LAHITTTLNFGGYEVSNCRWFACDKTETS